jgi:hypothetical protein
LTLSILLNGNKWNEVLLQFVPNVSATASLLFTTVADSENTIEKTG